MISHQPHAGAVRNELANVIREVNAAAADAPDVPELTAAWLALDKSLRLATVSGDDRAARAAVDRYRERALAAIAEVSA